MVTAPVRPDPGEVAWFGRLTEPDLEELVRGSAFVPDAREAFDRYRALGTASLP
ncbi:hypothetical protein [Streptomyces sp. NPDC089795]|uniref:hypothetical protein n=1 Tax=Streptomyces sp. NPDC089795 TaxID=3155297 RepID=UPI00343EEC95